MTLWDTHCHLADPRFAADRAEVLERTRGAGVQTLVVVAADPDAWDSTTALDGVDRSEDPRLRFAYGLHPHEARLAAPAVWERLVRRLQGPNTVALGEIGLDHHYDFSTPETQREALEHQLSMAADQGLPIILHERETASELLEVLRGCGLPPRGGVWHCFSGGPALAEEAVGLGLHLGFGGLVTFARGTESVREAAVRCPAHRLLLETDAPYLAPVPHRGKRNEPARVRDVLEFLAELRGVSPVELAAITTANARRLFERDEGGGGKP